MDMSMTTTAAMATVTADSMAPTTSSDASMAMTMSDMSMTFFTAITTPLFSDAWTPSSTGPYAGTCIFLIALAAILRALISFKPVLETRYWQSADEKTAQIHGHAEEGGSSKDLLVAEAMSAHATARHTVRRRWASWNIGSAAGRATYELLIVGVGYLLMLAVMTMNVGYFLSVLAGAWLGTFSLGALADDSQWEHC